MYNKKRMPCAIPTVCTICGDSHIYFNGIAIPSNTRNEIASKVLIILKVFIEEFKLLYFSAKINFVYSMAILYEYINCMATVHLK